MTWQLQRDSCLSDRVDGHLVIDGTFRTGTLESARRAESPLIPFPAIPAGTYPLVVRYSLRLQRMVPVLNQVPGRVCIEMAAGAPWRHAPNCILLESPEALDAVMVLLAQAHRSQQAVTMTVTDPSVQ